MNRFYPGEGGTVQALKDPNIVYGIVTLMERFRGALVSLVGVLFVILAIAHPHQGGEGFLLAAVPVLFIFVSGMLADLMETRHGLLVTACTVGIIAAYVVFSVSKLLEVPVG